MTNETETPMPADTVDRLDVVVIPKLSDNIASDEDALVLAINSRHGIHVGETIHHSNVEAMCCYIIKQYERRHSVSDSTQLFSPLSIAENKAELLAEDIECLHLCLDGIGIPRDDGKGNTYSMWGRVTRAIARPQTGGPIA